MRFEVPKFIDVEDKIFGPFTWKQFLYLCGGIGVFLIVQKIIGSLFWAIIITSPIIALVLALVFYKINGQDFSIILKSAFQYYFKQKIYVWRLPKKSDSKKSMPANKPTNKPVKEKSTSIDDVAWGLDVLDREK